MGTRIENFQIEAVQDIIDMYLKVPSHVNIIYYMLFPNAVPIERPMSPI